MRLWRVSTLLLPSLAAWAVVRLAGRADDRLVAAGVQALLPLFCVMAAALLVRAVEAVGARRTLAHGLEALDLLTAPGRALSCTAALATVGAVAIGWASLAVVGMLGFALLFVMVTWSALVAAGEEPWSALAVRRGFAPSTAVEGDALVEELTVTGARVPAGFRLFARGGLAGHAASAYALDADASGAELSLSAELDPARRGEHEAPPVELWLQDIFGVCRSRLMRFGAARLTVLPRPAAIDDPTPLLGARGLDDESAPSTLLPTEGCFRLRSYAPGDDARRIHWVRSLTARELIVRLPDEIPPDQPALRLVLDTQLVGADSLRTPATAQLCDALVRVWLSAGQSLMARGARVTMVAVAGGRVVDQAMTPQSSGALLRLGARVAWHAVPLQSLLVDDAGALVVSARPRPVDGEVSWIVVPERLFTDPEPPPMREPWATLPHPSGSADNRWLRRRRARQEHEQMRQAGLVFDQLMQWSDGAQLRGSLVARPRGARLALEAIR